MMRTIVDTLMVQSIAGGLLIAFMLLLRKLCAEKHWYKLTFINYGDGSEDAVPPAIDYVLGSRLLRKGMTGADVRAMQELLMQLGYELPEHGADGDFGSETLKALLRFQRAEELEAVITPPPKTIIPRAAPKAAP